MRVIPVNDLVELDETAVAVRDRRLRQDGRPTPIWLLDNGVDPGAIVWIRPRDPWMINRAAVQPDPVVFLTTETDIMEAEKAASSPDDLFFRTEDAGVMVRIDRSVTPTMAKIATLAHWELDRLRTIERVVRLGHIVQVKPGRLMLADGEVAIARDAVVVHCAAGGLRYPPLVPVWDEAITLQTIRNTYACFGPALAGYVEARLEYDAEKNRMCPPVPFSNTTADWAHRAGAPGCPRILQRRTPTWRNGPTACRSTRPAIPPELASSPAVAAAARRFRELEGPGLAKVPPRSPTSGTV